MTRAFHELFQVPNAFDGIEMAGRTDKWILENAASRSGVSLSTLTFQRLLDTYFSRLRETLAEPVSDKDVLPGVSKLLTELADRDDILLALLTGNCEAGARIKLEHFDLWKFFRCGAFGDDVHDRNELFPVAMARAAEQGVTAKPQDVIVIGDTVFDVACARAAGARSIAVATGPSNAERLAESGADLVLEDLSDTQAVFEMLRYRPEVC